MFLEMTSERYLFFSALMVYWYILQLSFRITWSCKVTWSLSFCHLCSAFLHSRLAVRVVSLSQGSCLARACVCCKEAIVFNKPVQSVEESNCATFLKADKKSAAVEGFRTQPSAEMHGLSWKGRLKSNKTGMWSEKAASSTWTLKTGRPWAKTRLSVWPCACVGAETWVGPETNCSKLKASSTSIKSLTRGLEIQHRHRS